MVVYGWVFAAHQLGAATAAEGAGAIRDAAGTYTPAFLVAGALSVLAALIVLFAQGRAGPPGRARPWRRPQAAPRQA
jgi:hypothetical protein